MDVTRLHTLFEGWIILGHLSVCKHMGDSQFSLFSNGLQRWRWNRDEENGTSIAIRSQLGTIDGGMRTSERFETASGLVIGG
jgi:hypothetical protein